MSEALKGRVSEDIEDEAAPLESSMVTVVATVMAKNGEEPVVGILRSVLFDNEPEVEFKVQLSDAFDIIEAPSLRFKGFELHYGSRVVEMPGPFQVKGARLDEVNPMDGMCLLALGLRRPPKA